MELQEKASPQSQLKTLIAKGKEQGFLTYHEVNDHLPSDIVDPEQIEDIVNMINDMGITVHEVAPDTDELLLNGGTTVDEEAAEEAAAALASVDNEFGRTTDPVRMYMREMGTVDLLTREGEIEIAKRIEDGLKSMVQAISACPGIIDDLMTISKKVKKAEIGVDEFIDGLIDMEAEKELAKVEAALEMEASGAEAEEEDENDTGKASGMSPEDLAKLTEEVLRRFGVITVSYTHLTLPTKA